MIIQNNQLESKRKQTKEIPPNCVYSQPQNLEAGRLKVDEPKSRQNKNRRKIRIPTKSSPKFSCRALRDEAGRILERKQKVKDTNEYKDYRVCKCGKSLIPPDKEKGTHSIATIYEHIETKKRIFGGLKKCGSVWLCADCARKITDGRRAEIEKGILECDKRGYMVLMITFTHSHNITDTLSNLLKKSAEAKRSSKSGYKYKKLKEDFNIIGSIVAHEITYGTINGWHPHYHELLILKEKISAERLRELEASLRQIWEAEAEKQGLSMNEHGFHLTATRGKIQDYLAKWGREPKDPSKVWGVSEEMVKGQMKQARRIEGLTPFAMLAIIKSLRNTEQTKETVKRSGYYTNLFIEYAEATLGRQQVRWSKGLKKMLGIEEKTDEELVEEFIEHCEPIAGLLEGAFLIAVMNDLLEEILKMDMVEMKLLLCSLGAIPQDILLYRPEDIARWREAIGEANTPEPPPDREEIIYTPEPNEAELEIMEALKPYNVRFIAEPCPKCGSHLKRNVLGDIECCNCSTSPLWSNQTTKRIKIIALDRKRTKLKSTNNR